jgi:hypothetical protein
MMRSGGPMKEATVRETERVRRIQDAEAPRYDRNMGFFDRILFAGGREWACSQVHGEVLELAVGTGRNLPYYRPDVRLTGIEWGSSSASSLASPEARDSSPKGGPAYASLSAW